MSHSEAPFGPEMPRLVPISRIGAGLTEQLEATASERVQLAHRMGLPAIHAFTCRFDLQRAGSTIVEAEGDLHAKVRQICGVTMEEFDAEVAERFRVRFVPSGTESTEIDLEADDEIPYEGHAIDIGEAASEQLALALDPFPRKPGAEMPDEEDAPLTRLPFATLAKLRRGH